MGRRTKHRSLCDVVLSATCLRTARGTSDSAAWALTITVSSN